MYKSTSYSMLTTLHLMLSFNANASEHTKSIQRNISNLILQFKESIKDLIVEPSKNTEITGIQNTGKFNKTFSIGEILHVKENMQQITLYAYEAGT